MIGTVSAVRNIRVNLQVSDEMMKLVHGEFPDKF
jgi:hypothetical protein